MDEQRDEFQRPKRFVELALDSFWIAVLTAMAFYVFGLVLGIVHPGEALGLTLFFVVLCVMWGVHTWRAHRNQAYLMSDPRLHRDRERRGY